MKKLVWFTVLALAACGGTTGQVGATDLKGADETAQTSDALTSCVTTGSTLATTTALNLRTGTSTAHSIILVIPSGGHVTALSSCPSGGWYHISYAGHAGYSYGGYLVTVSAPPPPPPTPVAQAFARAKSGVGFSYDWGGSAWQPGSSAKGACYGYCFGPSCHSGAWGADCSGYVAKIWQVPAGNTDLTRSDHTFVAVNWTGSNGYWDVISRASVRPADAYASSGHVFLYESGDAWGQAWAYEASSCSSGIIHDLRTTSGYVPSHRKGY